jgi:sepiapterin reductase
MASAIDLRDKLVFLMVTGASKGIGAKMAIESSRNFRAGSVVLLLARSESGLEMTKQEVLKSNAGLKVITKSIDLTKPSPEVLKHLISDSYDARVAFDLVMVIHNVGTLGDVTKWASDIDDYNYLESYFSTNVFGPIILNNLLLKVVLPTTRKFIINITSKAAISPFKSFGFYCAGKSAREMFFRVLAQESSDVLVLNYSPGPVETDMTVDAQRNAVSVETSEMFKTARDTGTILTTDQTTKRFLEVVAKGNYNSGDHVDFYDEN